MATHTATAHATPRPVLDALDQFCRGGVDTPLIMACVANGLSPEYVVDLINARQLAIRNDGPGGGRQLIRLARLRRLIQANASGYASVRSFIVNEEHEHWRDQPTSEGLNAVAAWFDRAVAINPIASIAYATIGSADRLERDTAEFVAWLLHKRVLFHGADVFDLGCGIGRLAAAVASLAHHVQGVDVSRGMVEYARTACRELPQVSIRQIDGGDLSPFPDASQHLIIACDVFPYLVQIGTSAALIMLRECWRILRPGGTIAVVSWSYDGDAHDRRNMPAIAAQTGFRMVADGAEEQALGGCRFLLFKPATPQERPHV